MLPIINYIKCSTSSYILRYSLLSGSTVLSNPRTKLRKVRDAFEFRFPRPAERLHEDQLGYFNKLLTNLFLTRPAEILIWKLATHVTRCGLRSFFLSTKVDLMSLCIVIKLPIVDCCDCFWPLCADTGFVSPWCCLWAYTRGSLRSPY